MKKSSLKVNIIYSTLYQILLIIVPLVTAPYISRTLGTSGLGEYSYTYSIAHYFALFAILGISTYGNREIARIGEDKQRLSQAFYEIFSVQLTFGTLSLILYIIFVLVFGGEYRLIFASQTLYLLSAILDISWFFFGIEKFKFTALLSSANKIICTALVFLLVNKREDVFVYTSIVAGAALVNHFILLILAQKYLDRGKYSLKSISKHIKPILVLFIPVIAVSLYKYMDKIMLGSMLNTSEVGIYESAEKFINLPLGVITAFGTVMIPRITNLKAIKEETTISKYNFISMIVIMFLSTGITFGLGGVSDIFIPWFYGESFTPASEVLDILLPSVLFISWANVVRTQCLLPNNKDKDYCISVIFGALVNFGINFVLIPLFGARGAAVGTTVAEFSVCIIQCISTRKLMDFKKYILNCLPFLCAGVLMFLCIFKINANSAMITIIIRIIFGAIIYILLSVPVFLKISKYRQEKK